MSKVGFIGRIGQPYPIGGPWYLSNQYAAIATDGTVVYPSYIDSFITNQYAKGAYNGVATSSTFAGNLENFTRASTATYFDATGALQTAAINVPRFTYNSSTLQPLGLLGEESRTNLCLRSEDYTNSTWTKVGLTITPTMLPNGINGALLPDSSYANYAVYNNSNAAFIVSQTAYATTSSVQRYTVAFTTPVGCTSIRIYPIRKDGTSHVYQNIGVLESTSYVMTFFANSSGNGGVQLEQASYPTSYIPTTSTTVTRARDSAISNDLGWYNASARKGSFIVKCTAPLGASSFDRILQIDDSTSNNYIAIQRNNTNLRFTVINATTTEANTLTTGFANGMYAKIGVSFEDNDIRVVLNGGTPATDTISTIPGLLNRISLLSGGGGGSEFNGTVESCVYYANTLTTAELQRLTT